MGIADRVPRAIADRRRQDEEAAVRGIGLQVGRFDRQRGHVAQRPHRAAGECACAREQRLGRREVRGQRVAEVEHRLQQQAQHEHRDRRSTRASSRGATVSGRPRSGSRSRSRARPRWTAGGGGGSSARAERSVTVGGPSASSSTSCSSSARRRRERDQFGATVEHGPAVAAADLAVAQRQLGVGDAKNRLATGAACEFFVGHRWDAGGTDRDFARNRRPDATRSSQRRAARGPAPAARHALRSPASSTQPSRSRHCPSLNHGA